ncbi:MAG: hypothetical protein ABJB22_07950 [Verrucomicrobiota bacterium]
MKSRHLFIHIVTILAFLFIGTLTQAASISIDVLTTFDYPGTGNLTRPQKINDAGDIAGEFIDSSLVTRGFVRFRNGNFSAPIVDPNDTANFTDTRGVNNSRTVCGFYLADNVYHGFFLSGGAFTPFDVADSLSTYLNTINDAGDFGGTFIDSSTLSLLGFLNIGGSMTAFSIPGVSATNVYGMNNLDQCVGEYLDSGSVPHGFFRDVDGTLTFPIDPPGSVETFLFGMNDRGWMVGRYRDGAGATHGVFYQTLNRFVVFDYPGSTFTSFNGINRQGLICGRYLDSSGIEHGILARVRRVPGD